MNKRLVSILAAAALVAGLSGCAADVPSAAPPTADEIATARLEGALAPDAGEAPAYVPGAQSMYAAKHGEKTPGDSGYSPLDMNGAVVGFSTSMATIEDALLAEDLERAAMDRACDFIVTDAQNDVSLQITQMSNLISQGVDMLIVHPIDDDAILPIVEASVASGIPVVVAGGSPGPYSHLDGVTCVGPDREWESHMCAGALLGLQGSGVPVDGVLELAGAPGNARTAAWSDGFSDALGDSLPIVRTMYAGNFAAEQAMSNMETAIASGLIGYSSSAVYAHTGPLAYGAVQAMHAAGLVLNGPDGVYVVCAGGGVDAVEMAGSGELFFAAVPTPFLGDAVFRVVEARYTGAEAPGTVLVSGFAVSEANAAEVLALFGD